MITIEHDKEYLVCRVSGTLTKSDYDAALPEFENALRLRGGAIRLMVILENFSGWTPPALWEDLKFDAKHRDDFARIAIVGETALEEWGAWATKLFFGGEIRFFWTRNRAEAATWLSTRTAGSRERAPTGSHAA